jgi:hypothetical protein
VVEGVMPDLFFRDRRYELNPGAKRVPSASSYLGGSGCMFCLDLNESADSLRHHRIHAYPPPEPPNEPK